MITTLYFLLLDDLNLQRLDFHFNNHYRWAFLNDDIILYTFQDIKDVLKNLFKRKVVLYNCKYFNEY